MTLKEIICEEISTSGPMTFHQFMDMCLYYPDLGYYTSNRPQFGRAGDYYTSSALSGSYGAVIAKQLAEMWVNLNKADFTIVEFGAGSGALCKDILTELLKIKELHNRLRYIIIEKSPVMRQREQMLLGAYPEVCWYSDIKKIPGDIDCIFSNELFDNFPVHIVVMEQQLMEVFVDYNGAFFEVLQPASDVLINYFEALDMQLPMGYRAEVNLNALEWLKDMAGSLKKGYLITIDYGDISKRLYKSHRRDGTVVCYFKHEVSADPFCHIGEQDITAHINFSALMNYGERSGLDTCGITSQGYFLASLGIREHISEAYKRGAGNVKRMAVEEAFIRHTLLFDMGCKYQVLIQSKGVGEKKLTGLQMEISG